jgi:hypothetical protein
VYKLSCIDKLQCRASTRCDHCLKLLYFHNSDTQFNEQKWKWRHAFEMCVSKVPLVHLLWCCCHWEDGDILSRPKYFQAFLAVWFHYLPQSYFSALCRHWQYVRLFHKCPFLCSPGKESPWKLNPRTLEAGKFTFREQLCWRSQQQFARNQVSWLRSGSWNNELVVSCETKPVNM